MSGNGEAARDGINAVRDIQLAMMARTPGLRGQHPKQHGLVQAEFKVRDDLPDRLRIGLFAQPMTYAAYIRFSNGASMDDTKRDIHGMAIKLTGVPGRKILENEVDATTHDFILVDFPVFIIRNVEDYVFFMKDVVRSAQLGKPPEAFIDWLQNNRPEDVPVLKSFLWKRIQDSPLAAQYWSQVPYAFGDDSTICRYSVRPHGDNLIVPVPASGPNPDYLREAMVQHLTTQARPAHFDFCVQVFEGATNTEIDNPTVVWNVPEQPVATITIPPQTFDTEDQQRFGEDLSYTPWHALPEHRPVGQINEIRKTVYLASSGLRHGTRGTSNAEP